jgi:hypothetical protein
MTEYVEAAKTAVVLISTIWAMVLGVTKSLSPRFWRTFGFNSRKKLVAEDFSGKDENYRCVFEEEKFYALTGARKSALAREKIWTAFHAGIGTLQELLFIEDFLISVNKKRSRTEIQFSRKQHRVGWGVTIGYFLIELLALWFLIWALSLGPTTPEGRYAVASFLLVAFFGVAIAGPGRRYWAAKRILKRYGQ